MGSEQSAQAAPEEDEASVEPGADNRDVAEEGWSSESSSWRSDTTAVPGLVASSARAELLKNILGEEAAARDAFHDLWICCRPQNDVAPRIRIHEVLLQAARQLNEVTPHRSAQVSQLLGSALRGSSQVISFEEAFQRTRKALRSLPGIEGILDRDSPRKGGTSSSSSLFPSPDLSLGRGMTAVDRSQPTPWLAGLQLAGIDTPRRPSHWLNSPTPSAGLQESCPSSPSSPTGKKREDPSSLLTRSQLESTHARLSAEVAAARTAKQSVVDLVQEMRIRLGDSNAQQSRSRARVENLEAELEYCNTRLVELQHDVERHNQELLGLMKDCTGWVLQAGESRMCRDEVRADCEEALQDAEDLERQLVAEQLRVLMLRNAYEENEPNFGASIDATKAALQQKYSQDTQGFEREETAAMQELSAIARKATLEERQDRASACIQEAALREELESGELLVQATQDRIATTASARAHQAKVSVLRSSLAGLQVRLAHQTASNGLPSMSRHNSGSFSEREIQPRSSSERFTDIHLAEVRTRLWTGEAELEEAESRLSEKLSQAAALMAMRGAAAELADVGQDLLEDPGKASVSSEVLLLQRHLAAVLAREAEAHCSLAEEELALHGCSALLAE